MFRFQFLTWLFSALGVLAAITVHEWGHAMASDLLGDPTPRRAGRLSLNPLHHLDPAGTLALLFFRFGWAKPVPVDPRYYKHPRLGMALVALAGVGMNLLTAFLFALLFVLSHRLNPLSSASVAAGLSFVAVNCALVVCNLTPLPPLDGFHFWAEILPAKAVEPLTRFFRRVGLRDLVYGQWGTVFCLLILVFFGSRILGPLVMTLTGWVWNAALLIAY